MKNFPYELADGVYSKLSKDELLAIYNQADLLIMDADETVAPNITVGLANEIFNHIILATLTDETLGQEDKIILTPKDMLKKVIGDIHSANLHPKKTLAGYVLLSKLLLKGVKLYNKRISSQIMAKFAHTKASHKKILDIVVNTLTDKKMRNLFEKVTGKDSISNSLYTLAEVENSLYHGVKEFVDHLSKQSSKKNKLPNKKNLLKKIMISESFSVENSLKNSKIKNSKKESLGMVEHYSKIFKLNCLFSNQFICDKNGSILDVKINIQCAEDKKRFAQESIAKYKAKNVIVMANDWEDWEMCALPEVKLVVLRDPPKGMYRYAHVVVKDGYDGLII